MIFKNKFFKFAFGCILVLIIVFLLVQIAPLLGKIAEFITTLLFPLLFSGLLFYILRPLRDVLEYYKVPRLIAIILIFLSLFSLILFAIVYIWPFFSEQFREFTKSPSGKIEAVQNKTIDFLNFFNFTNLSPWELREYFHTFLQSSVKWVTQDVGSLLGKITHITSLIVFTPFILFYLLKDGDRLSENVLKVTPKKYKKFITILLQDIDDTLSVYISGQFIIAVIIGILMYVGYLMIGLPYAFLLATFALVFNLIPFIGTFISTIPAFIIGFAVNPLLSLKVVAVVLIVHAFDANLISPNILGMRLHIHPLTIILILLASGSFYGIAGLLLATPLYALIRVVILDIIEHSSPEDEKLLTSTFKSES